MAVICHQADGRWGVMPQQARAATPPQASPDGYLGAGSDVKLRYLAGIVSLLQPVSQEALEEMVVAIPAALVVQEHSEQVVLLQPLQARRGYPLQGQGSAHMSRGFQGARPSLYDFEKEIRKLTTPALIVVGDEDERCIEPAIFLKDAISASGLALLPKTGHAVNLEEPDLFNQVVGDFLARVDRGKWLPRDPRTRAPKPPPKTS